jgi:hypothetical protein
LSVVLTTAVSILAAIALLLPGFLIDLELALRALSYALIVHLAFSAWTVHLVQTVGPPDQWHRHVNALVFYGAVVLLIVPVGVGVAANLLIANIERQDGPPPLWAAALGAGEARDGYDFMWQRVRDEGTWVIVELVGHSKDEPRLLGGLYGSGSAVGQTPAEHDLYLQRLCFVRERPDGLRELLAATDPPRGVWIAASQIARIETVPVDSGSTMQS